MLSPEEAVVVRDQFSLMKFFPSDPGAKAALSRMLQRMCRSFEEAQWLVDRALDVYGDWPGTSELRALYCSRFKPMDGIEADSAIFPDGIPSMLETEPPALTSGARQLEAGEPVSADPELALVVVNLVQRNTMNVIVSKPEETALRDGENDLSGLLRVISEARAAREARLGARAATDEEIREIKRLQAANAQHEETRRSLLADDAGVDETSESAEVMATTDGGK